MGKVSWPLPCRLASVAEAVPCLSSEVAVGEDPWTLVAAEAVGLCLGRWLL